MWSSSVGSALEGAPCGLLVSGSDLAMTLRPLPLSVAKKNCSYLRSYTKACDYPPLVAVLDGNATTKLIKPTTEPKSEPKPDLDPEPKQAKAKAKAQNQSHPHCRQSEVNSCSSKLNG